MGERDNNIERLIASINAQSRALTRLVQGELDTPISVSQLASRAAERAIQRLS